MWHYIGKNQELLVMKLENLITKLIKLEDEGHGKEDVMLVDGNTLLDIEGVDIVMMPIKGKDKIIIVIE